MAIGQATSRGDRRRRVLQDEKLRSGHCPPPEATEGARYTAAANVENHPQITQFIPRKWSSYALLLGGAALLIAAVVAAHLHATTMANAIGSGPIAAFDFTAGGRLAAWLGSLTLVGCALVAVMVYGLRRHRIDDYKARYRSWLVLACVTLMASADVAANLHQPYSDLWVRVTGWSPLGGDVWWLAPIGLVCGWLAFRLLTDVAECTTSFSMLALAIVAYTVAAVSAYAQLPAFGRVDTLALMFGAMLAGNVLLLAGVTAYARYLVLDVQGLIDHRCKRASASGPASARELESIQPSKVSICDDDSQPEHQSTHSKKKRRSTSAKSNDLENQPTEWVDGSEPETDYDDDDVNLRRLSKAQRKRMRRQQRKCA